MRSTVLRVCFIVGVAAANAPVGAQVPRAWDDPAALELVGRATARRGAQLADTGLADYRAIARGYVTFLAQFGEGLTEPPQVVRTDQLAVEVYWRAPNRSKQRVIGRRAVLSRPTDIAYHRDHLAIVQNNFPAIIRLGDGDEVRDVPHPLSPAGRAAYEFAAADSLTIRVGDRVWDVFALDFRPRDPALPRAVGTVYLDRETAFVVRFAIGFTRAALIDPALEDVAVVLDNGLVEGRFWLPRRQEIEIRRTGTWLDFPARGIIRGEWDLCCVEANVGLPPERFAGPEITFAPRESLEAYPFAGQLRDSIRARSLGAGPDREAALVQRRTAVLVARSALQRATRPALLAGGISDFVRVNRVEGLALGAGLRLPLAPGYGVRLLGRYGLDDEAAKARAQLVADAGPARVSLVVHHDFTAAGDAQEVSGLGNSIAAQEFRLDATDDFGTVGAAVAVATGSVHTWTMTLGITRERPLDVHARGARQAFRPALPAERLDRVRLALETAGVRVQPDWTLRWRIAGAVSAVRRDTVWARRSSLGRVSANLLATRRTGTGELSARAIVAANSGAAPVQDFALFGGPTTGPGYVVHSIRGRRGAALRAEWRVPVARIGISLGRFGTTETAISLAPFTGVVSADGEPGGAGRTTSRYLGIGLIGLYDGLRLDVARGVDDGGRWQLRVDFGSMLWPVL